MANVSWGCQTLHFVWFLAKPERPLESELFRLATSAEPQLTQSQNTPMGPVSFATGNSPFGEHRIQIQTGRVDHVMQMRIKSHPLDVEPLDKIQEACDLAITGAKRVAQKLGDVNRISMIVKLVRRAASMKEASRQFMEVVGLPQQNIDGLSDLIFQINKVKVLPGAGDFPINRLLKCEIEQYMMVNNPVLNMGVANQVPGTETSYSCSITLDVNTPVIPVHPLPYEVQGNTFDAILTEIKRLATEPTVRNL